jgi:hypothetical protein
MAYTSIYVILDGVVYPCKLTEFFWEFDKEEYAGLSSGNEVSSLITQLESQRVMPHFHGCVLY